MATKAQIISNLDWLTERVSNRVWTISAGIVVVSLAYVVESSRSGETSFLTPQQVSFPAIIAILSLSLDMLQYVLGTKSHIQMLKKMERENIAEAMFDYRAPLYLAQTIAYNLKLICCFVASVWMMSVILKRTIELM